MCVLFYLCIATSFSYTSHHSPLNIVLNSRPFSDLTKISIFFFDEPDCFCFVLGPLSGQLLGPCSSIPYISLKYPCFVVTRGCSNPALIIPALRYRISYPSRIPFKVMCL